MHIRLCVRIVFFGISLFQVMYKEFISKNVVCIHFEVTQQFIASLNVDFNILCL